MSSLAARIALLTAPVAAAAATLLLVVIGGQVANVLVWGGAATLVAAIPLAVPERHRRVAIWACSALLLVMIALSILSIGVYFFPALLALIVVGLLPGPGK